MINEVVKKGDFIEIKYTGYKNGEVFDSNIEEDIKKLDKNLKVNKFVIVVGEGMVIGGLDKAFEGKNIGREYEISLSPKEGFGDRNRELIKTIPLSMFKEKNVDPRPGMMFNLDNTMARIIAVSGARVITDFNNPLAGKNIVYKFIIIKKVEDEKDKIETLFEFFFKTIPDFEIKDKIIVKGAKGMEVFVDAFKDKFKELMGKELAFELKEEKAKPEDKTEAKVSEIKEE